MNLLPRSSKEFGSVDYWEKFFQQRGKQAFEWYGTYLELCGVLHKYIKPREKVRATCACAGQGGSWLSAVGTVVLHPMGTQAWGPVLSGFHASFWLKDNVKRVC